jgi:hypothetical protein
MMNQIQARENYIAELAYYKLDDCFPEILGAPAHAMPTLVSQVVVTTNLQIYYMLNDTWVVDCETKTPMPMKSLIKFNAKLVIPQALFRTRREMLAHQDAVANFFINFRAALMVERAKNND